MNSSGTDEYISRIVETYSQMLFRIAYTALRSSADAEDIVQEVFVRLIKKRPDFNDSRHEKAWLIRVAINLSRSRLRELSRRSELCNEPAASPLPEDSDLLEAVLTLPEKYRTAIHLYYYEGYSIAACADILRLPAATVGTRLSRARAMLKKILEGDADHG